MPSSHGQGPPGPGEFPGSPPGIPPGTIIFGPKGNCTLDICPVEYSVYGYRPTLAVNIAFIILFAIAAGIHLYQGIRWKSWFFMACILVGCVSAILGYIGRVMMYYNPFNFSAFMLQITCVTTTPVYFCAAIYITLAKIIVYFSPNLSRCRPSFFYWFFIPCDFFSLVIQAAGGALSTTSKGTSQQGVNLALAGLSFQVFTICTFCGLMGDYLYRYFRSGNAAGTKLGWKLYTFFTFLSLAILLITMRCTYRLAELHDGYSGYMVRDEGLFIGLEGVLILLSVYALMLGHPGPVFKTADRKQISLENRGYELRDDPSSNTSVHGI
ncbi:parasitic phase-specific protein PSP-1 [Pochonia chlamydosporia 170]|uniref:Parasitic phase-specific protein PSP-1 n=1 Tax=Pochonia chlamydosporia 170 TaxID=1380566 RepID=A0A179EWQ2_METCM|nr:parasitic phase-specific protein PSP-1 [Pochonia chlamydosporia 170]OAQ57606.1 parasitic phase-specific protein PSP-1 [Pochonia chlamydosporia 170]